MVLGPQGTAAQPQAYFHMCFSSAWMSCPFPMVFLASTQEVLAHPLLSATTPYSYIQHRPSPPSSTLPTGSGSCDLQKALNLLMRFLREATLHLSNHEGPTWCSSPSPRVRGQEARGVRSSPECQATPEDELCHLNFTLATIPSGGSMLPGTAWEICPPLGVWEPCYGA